MEAFFLCIALPEIPKTKDRRPNLQTSNKVCLTSKSSPLRPHLERVAALFLWLACAMNDKLSTIQWLTSKCFPMITATNQRAPSRLCTALHLHFVSAGSQSADNFIPNSDLQDVMAGPWTKNHEPRTKNQEGITSLGPPHRHEACHSPTSSLGDWWACPSAPVLWFHGTRSISPPLRALELVHGP